jgi:hypothetical protein
MIVRCGLVAVALAGSSGCIEWESLSPPELVCPAPFATGLHSTSFDAKPVWAKAYEFGEAVGKIETGALVIELAPNMAANAYAGVQVERIVARERIFRTRLLDVPMTEQGETALSIASPDRSHFVGLSYRANVGLDTVVRDATGTIATPRAPLDALWLQLVTTGGSVSFQSSRDGVAWDELDVLPAPAYLAEATIVLESGTWAAASAPGRASFDYLLECE